LETAQADEKEHMTAKKIIFLITPPATHALDESLTKSEAELNN